MLSDNDKRPVTGGKFNFLWLKVTGRDKWIPTTAFDYSNEFVNIDNQEIGHYHVIYSYLVGDERYVGDFRDYGFEYSASFKRDGHIEIRYNPLQPSQSYYPDQRTDTRFRMICWGIGAGIAVIVVAVDWLRAIHGGR